MSLSQQIQQIWLASPHRAPRVPLIYHDNEYMITVDDTGPFLRFMSADGQIFLSLNRNCQIGIPDVTVGNEVYMCAKVDPILCSTTGGPLNAKDVFVVNNLLYLIE